MIWRGEEFSIERWTDFIASETLWLRAEERETGKLGGRGDYRCVPFEWFFWRHWRLSGSLALMFLVSEVHGFAGGFYQRGAGAAGASWMARRDALAN